MQGGRKKRLKMALCLGVSLLCSISARAACPPPPAGFVLPLAERVQVDLQRELEQPWQAGGEIVLSCAGKNPSGGAFRPCTKNQSGA